MSSKRKRDENPITNQFKRKAILNETKQRLGLELFNLEKSVFKCRSSFKSQLLQSAPFKKIHSFDAETLQKRLLTELMDFFKQDYHSAPIEFLYYNDSHQQQLLDYKIPRETSIIVQYKSLVIGFGFVQGDEIYHHVLHPGWTGYERYLEYYLTALFL